ncbi:MAG: methane monooxygenase/ammonia monooxygenase subunit B [Methylococcales bacterium]
MNKRIIIIGIVLIGLMGGYFGIKSYAKIEARKRVDSTLANYSSFVDIIYDDVNVSIPLMDISINNVVVKPIKGGQNITIEEVEVLKLDDKATIPEHLHIRFNGVNIPEDTIKQIDSQYLSQFTNNTSKNLEGNYEIQWDKDEKDFTVFVAVDIKNLFKTGISASLGNLTLDFSKELDFKILLENVLKLGNAIIREANIEYFDNSLLDKLLIAEAHKQNLDIDSFGANLLTKTDKAIKETKNERGRSILSMYQDFLVEGGTLKLSINPKPAMPISKLIRLIDDNHIEDILESLQVSAHHNASDKNLDRKGWFTRAMIEAASSNDLANVKKWLEKGTDINTTDQQGRTALLVAVRAHNTDLTDFLLSKGATLEKAYEQAHQEAFKLMHTILWFDMNWSKEEVTVNDTITISAKLYVSETWSETTSKPDAVFFNVGIQSTSPLDPTSIQEYYLGDQSITHPGRLELGETYEFKVLLKARRPGNWRIYPILSVEGSNPLLGIIGKEVTVKGAISNVNDQAVFPFSVLANDFVRKSYIEPPYALEMPPRLIKVTVSDASYVASAPAMRMKLTITNNESSPIRLGELNVAGARFFDETVSVDETGYPESLMAKSGLKVSNNTPIQPRETRDIEIIATGSAWEDFHLSDIIYGSDNRLGGQLMFYDEIGNREMVIINAPLVQHDK